MSMCCQNLPKISKLLSSKFSELFRNFWQTSTIFKKTCDFRAVQRSALCRSRRELSNAYSLANFGVDTAENEPSKVPSAGSPCARAGCRGRTSAAQPRSKLLLHGECSRARLLKLFFCEAQATSWSDRSAASHAAETAQPGGAGHPSFELRGGRRRSAGRCHLSSRPQASFRDV